MSTKITTTAAIMGVGPELASEWLANRLEEQRTVRKTHVSRLASEMLAGRFKLGPDAILRIRGKLANGQHRLEAVVSSGKAQQFIVLDSSDEQLYKILDSGIKRTVADSLVRSPYYKHFPACARLVLAWHAGKVTPRQRWDNELTQGELIEFCEGNADVLSDAASFVNPLYEKTMLLQSSIGEALFVLADEIGRREEARAFLTALYIDGGSNAAGDLRNRMIANKGAKARLPAGYIFGLTVKSFRSFVSGTWLGTLKWVTGEPAPSLEGIKR